VGVIVGSVVAEVDLFLLGLPDPTDHDRVLHAAARQLAFEIDTCVLGEKPRSAAGAVRELRSVLDELNRRRPGGDEDDEAGWGEVGKQPAVAGQQAAAAKPARARAAKVRDAEESGAGDVRGRGRGGRKATS
jgi:hypothetical protein